jgi:hypothetical protein
MTLNRAATRAPRRRGWIARLVRWGLLAALAALLVLASLLLLWRFVPPVSTLMLGRWMTLQQVERVWTPLERISPNLVAAVIASEDARFCSHAGVDWDALDDQLDAKGGPQRGASTITMQTAKNLFLWPQRSYIRKGTGNPHCDGHRNRMAKTACNGGLSQYCRMGAWPVWRGSRRPAVFSQICRATDTAGSRASGDRPAEPDLAQSLAAKPPPWHVDGHQYPPSGVGRAADRVRQKLRLWQSH